MKPQPGHGHEALHRRRKESDGLDTELLRLLNQRARIALDMASIKKSSSLPDYDGRREQQILDRISAENNGPLDSESITTIFRCIIRESRKAEESSMRRLNRHFFKQENHHGHQYGSKRVRC